MEIHCGVTKVQCLLYRKECIGWMPGHCEGRTLPLPYVEPAFASKGERPTKIPAKSKQKIRKWRREVHAWIVGEWQGPRTTSYPGTEPYDAEVSRTVLWEGSGYPLELFLYLHPKLWGYPLLSYHYRGMGFETKKDQGSISVFPIHLTRICFYATSYSVDFIPNRNHRFTNLINHRIQWAAPNLSMDCFFRFFLR